MTTHYFLPENEKYDIYDFLLLYGAAPFIILLLKVSAARGIRFPLPLNPGPGRRGGGGKVRPLRISTLSVPIVVEGPVIQNI